MASVMVRASIWPLARESGIYVVFSATEYSEWSFYTLCVITCTPRHILYGELLRHSKILLGYSNPPSLWLGVVVLTAFDRSAAHGGYRARLGRGSRVFSRLMVGRVCISGVVARLLPRGADTQLFSRWHKRGKRTYSICLIGFCEIHTPFIWMFSSIISLISFSVTVFGFCSLFCNTAGSSKGSTSCVTVELSVGV